MRRERSEVFMKRKYKGFSWHLSQLRVSAHLVHQLHRCLYISENALLSCLFHFAIPA